MSLHAAHACLSGRPERAIELLRGYTTSHDMTNRAKRRPRSTSPSPAAASASCSAATIAEADVFLRVGGALDPARLVATLMPGIAQP